jgi:hypothetical protein
MTPKKKKKELEKDYSSILTITSDQQTKIRQLLAQLRQENVPEYWEEPHCKILWIPVDNGEIRVLHIKPDKPLDTRPIIFIGGWQTMAYQFQETFEILHDRVEVYYVESRESYTSKLNRRKADMSVNQKAKDIQKVISYFNLENQDYVLFGTCWGATIVCQGLLDKSIKPPESIVIFSPMHKLWFNRFLLKIIVPLVPAFFVGFLLKVIPIFLFAGEKAKTQKNRIFQTIKDAESWKWKKAGIAAGDLELFGILHAIKEEVLVIGGTHDRVHKSYDYPKFADEMPNGRYFFFGIDEAERELTLGLLLLELSKISSHQKIPKIFEEYEKNLDF